MKSLVDIGPIPRPGDASAINATGGARRGESVFYQIDGPTGRQILDVGARDSSVMVDSPSESGVSGNPHYSDLMPLWNQGQYIPILYSRAAVEKHVSQRLVLDPSN
jgi:penicillin amidase